MRAISLASNATAADGPTLLRIVPHWLRVFGAHLAEIVIVVDAQPMTGRIGVLHRGQTDAGRLEDAIGTLESNDSRVRFVKLDAIEPAPIQTRWFGRARPVRCQAGTPLLAFVAAVEEARSDMVLRCDSDMLFSGAGWLEKEAIPLLEDGVNVYEPPRLQIDGSATQASSRAFMVSKERLDRWLPLRNLRLDPLRVLHRKSQGRPPWLALEQMITLGAEKKQLTHRIGSLDSRGFSLHGLKRAWTSAPWFDGVIHAVETCQLPEAQRSSWNFDPRHWGIEVQ
jgi:hypothetical protein